MLKLTENDLKIFFGEVIRNVAKELKIKKWKWRFNAELLEKIKAENQTVSEKLEEFFAVYKKWHKFHVKASPENIEGGTAADDSYELKTLVSGRNAARKALLKELSKKRAPYLTIPFKGTSKKGYLLPSDYLKRYRCSK